MPPGSSSSSSVGGTSVAVGRGVFVGPGVAVGPGVRVGRGVFVGPGVCVGRGVLVGCGTGVLVGVGSSDGKIRPVGGVPLPSPTPSRPQLISNHEPLKSAGAAPSWFNAGAPVQSQTQFLSWT